MYRDFYAITLSWRIKNKIAFLFGGFRPTRDFFHSYEDITITDEEL